MHRFNQVGVPTIWVITMSIWYASENIPGYVLNKKSANLGDAMCYITGTKSSQTRRARTGRILSSFRMPPDFHVNKAGGYFPHRPIRPVTTSSVNTWHVGIISLYLHLHSSACGPFIIFPLFADDVRISQEVQIPAQWMHLHLFTLQTWSPLAQAAKFFGLSSGKNLRHWWPVHAMAERQYFAFYVTDTPGCIWAAIECTSEKPYANKPFLTLKVCAPYRERCINL